MRDVHAAFEQHLLNVAVAQVNSILEPDPMAANFAGKAVILVPFGVSGWGHVGSYLGAEGSLEGHHRGAYVMGLEGWATT